MAVAGVHGQEMGDEQRVAGDHCVAYLDVLYGAARHQRHHWHQTLRFLVSTAKIYIPCSDIPAWAPMTLMQCLFDEGLMNCPAADIQVGTADTQVNQARGRQAALPARFRLWLDLADRTGVKNCARARTETLSGSWLWRAGAQSTSRGASYL